MVENKVLPNCSKERWRKEKYKMRLSKARKKKKTGYRVTQKLWSSEVVKNREAMEM